MEQADRHFSTATKRSRSRPSVTKFFSLASLACSKIPSKARDPLFLDDLPDIIPVGQGMVDVQLLVVDREDKTRLCQVGEQGELFIRAGGLAEVSDLHHACTLTASCRVCP